MGFSTPKKAVAPGVMISIPGEMVRVPELNLGNREDHEDLIEELREVRTLPDDAPREEKRKSEKRSMKILREIVFIALQQSYDGIEETDLRAFTLTDLRKAASFALAGPASGEAVAGPKVVELMTTPNGAKPASTLLS